VELVAAMAVLFKRHAVALEVRLEQSVKAARTVLFRRCMDIKSSGHGVE